MENIQSKNNYLLVTYIMKYISKDLYKRILDFSFTTCEKCNINKHYTEIINDCYLYEYLTVFDDNFNIQKPILYYKILCKICKNEYRKINIIAK